jgi:LPXTG-motif cell wall-anchored protein
VHILRTIGICLGLYSVVLGLPYFALWRSYKKALLRFVPVQDEVLVFGKSQQQPWLAIAGLTVLLLAGLIFFYFVRAK